MVKMGIVIDKDIIHKMVNFGTFIRWVLYLGLCLFAFLFPDWGGWIPIIVIGLVLTYEMNSLTIAYVYNLYVRLIVEDLKNGKYRSNNSHGGCK